MNINRQIDELRKPATQALSLFALFMILFTGITFFFGLKYEMIPFYLKAVTVMELIVIVISLLQYFRIFNFKDKNQINEKTLKRYAKFLTIINVIGTYNAVIAFSNLFYFMAIQNYIDLYQYWLFSMLNMLICFAIGSIGSILMNLRLPKIESIVNVKQKTFIGFLLVFLSQLIYIGKIVEYMMVPNIADSKFLVLGVIGLIIPAKFIAFQWIIKYADFKIVVLDEK